MVPGNQEQQTNQDGLGLDQISNVVSMQKIGDRRLRNEMIRQGVQDPGSFALQNQEFLQEAQQPQELRWAGFEDDMSSRNASLGNLKQLYNVNNFQNVEAPNDSGTLNSYNPEWNAYNLSQLYSGQMPSMDDWSKGVNVKGIASSDNNKAENILKGLIDPLYTSTYTKQLVQGLGQSLGLSSAEVDNVARVLAGSYYQNSSDNSYTPFQLGRGYVNGNEEQMYANEYVKALLQYANGKGISPDQELINSSLSSATEIDKYLRKLRTADDEGGGGFLGDIFNFLDPILDTLDPMHNQVQTWTTGSSDTEGQMPYFETIMPMILNGFFPGVGSAVSALNSGSKGDWNSALASGLMSMYSLGDFNSLAVPVETGVSSSGELANGLASNTGGIFGSGLSLGSTATDQAAQQALMSSAANYAKTGDLETALMSGAGGLMSSQAGDFIGNLSKESGLNDVVSKMFGGAASGGLNSLFSGNNVVNGSLFGAMSGGLHGYLNSTGKTSEGFLEPEKNLANGQISKNLSNILKLLSRAK